DRVNLERSLAVGDRFGGHYVLGHVDGVGTVLARREGGGETRLRIDAGDWVRWIIPKGSIAVDGVSLTVTEVEGRSFGVAVVPYTLQQTALGDRRPGDKVHLECDPFGKWIFQAVREIIAGRPPRDLAEALRAAGYLAAGGAEGEGGR
ncbi:MAG: riboflavin synthase, partial [Planctomycetes bacterium]|nr:riboflavin synthase [Planctomycetota bacterium]